jgi:hypothetical protein
MALSSPTTDSGTLTQSSRPGAGLRDSGSTTAPTASTTVITGTLIRKTEPHQNRSSSSPPTTGPNAKPAAPIPLLTLVAVVRSLGSVKAWRTIDRVDGKIIAPAAPSTARAQMSSAGLVA